ncbi:MAG: hypothetical protein GWN87_29525, partial [Desulfuromonadales bacterium]|nr:hypothetical protein [Desulfuromonadales bacterium]
MRSDASVPLTIGAWIGDGGGYSTSTIDDLKIFDTVLGEEEVQALNVAPTPIVLSENIIPTSAPQGDAVGTLSTPGGDENDTFTYALVAGEGDTDNGKFQIDGDELQAGAFDFSGVADDTEFSVRVEATGSPSGDTFQTSFIIVAEGDSDADGLPDEYELMWADDLDELSGMGDADADDDGL